MDVIKIQQELLKEAYNCRYLNKELKWNYETDEEHVALIKDGIAIYYIPINNFLLDLEKVFESKAPMNMQRVKDGADDAKDLTFIGERTYDKAKIMVFKLPDNEEVWLDKRLLKCFKTEYCTFRGTIKKYPVYVYEDGCLQAIILPINHR